MTWVKLSPQWIEDFEDHGAEAVVLHIAALSLSARRGTDGVLTSRDVSRLWSVSDLAATVAVLVAAGEWEPIEDGWLLVHWQDHLLSAAEVAHRREQSRMTTERHRRHKAGDHSMCDRCAAIRGGDTSRDASLTASVTTSVTPLVTSRLVTSRLEVKRERRDGEQPPPDSAGATSADDETTRRLPVPHPFLRDDEHGFSCGSCGLPPAHDVHVPARAEVS